ncbi:MAG TPA: hypothetical protein PLI16_03555 [Bacteroidales bacterium]|jgi:hypothetical protein|nr:hypothetical protein [Bacteroidales bacterium]OPZ95466.1 MAG: hypothetical protein BWY70_01998 [Bacteroidetes bacterium ADurb.Bin408]HNZ41805.1 hypothetical protein [Bacteroidales bacterium]HOH83663.1 hypothetical protein [Bacteroidales bacterium]HPB25490.1 hypothetical protein [Bacteroidales bacterium]
MKRLFILAAILLTIGIVPRSLAQKHEVKSPWFKNGSVLTYHVVNGAKEYNYIVSDLDLSKDISFRWKMTEPVNYNGSIKIFDAALDTAMKMVNYFENGSALDMNNKTTAMFSRKAYKMLIGQQPVSVNIDNAQETVGFERYENYHITVDGVQQQVEVMVASTATGKKFWILDNPKFPLIIKMELAFTIDLRTVNTAD